MPYPYLAGTRYEAVAGALQLFIGDAPIVTDSAPALANIKQWEVLVLSDTGVTPWDGTASDAAAPMKLVVAQVPALAGQQCPYYTEAKLNHEVLVWPAAVNTYELRKNAVQGSGIHVGHPI